jgi:hypothetical protein
MWLKYRKDKALQYLMMVVYFFLGWAVTTGPNTGIDVIAPGRQDMSLEDNNPVFRSADINCGTARLIEDQSSHRGPKTSASAVNRDTNGTTNRQMPLAETPGGARVRGPDCQRTL